MLLECAPSIALSTNDFSIRIYASLTARASGGAVKVLKRCVPTVVDEDRGVAGGYVVRLV